MAGKKRRNGAVTKDYQTSLMSYWASRPRTAIEHLSKILAVSSLALAASACDVNKTEEGEMPDVDVDAGEMPEYEVKKTEEGELPEADIDGGELPEYEVDTMDVDVDTETKEVEVPVVDVEMPEEDDDDSGN